MILTVRHDSDTKSTPMRSSRTLFPKPQVLAKRPLNLFRQLRTKQDWHAPLTLGQNKSTQKASIRKPRDGCSNRRTAKTHVTMNPSRKTTTSRACVRTHTSVQLQAFGMVCNKQEARRAYQLTLALTTSLHEAQICIYSDRHNFRHPNRELVTTRCWQGVLWATWMVLTTKFAKK